MGNKKNHSKTVSKFRVLGSIYNSPTHLLVDMMRCKLANAPINVNLEGGNEARQRLGFELKAFFMGVKCLTPGPS